jgi:hypothetical protein
MDKMRIAQFLTRVTIVTAMMVMAGGCMFTPREPDVPTSGETIPYLSRVNPENVWANLQVSLNYSDSFGWEENLHPLFTYIPDSEAENQFPGAFVDWNRDKELNFIRNFYDAGVENLSKMRNDEFNKPDPVGNEVRWEGVIYYIKVTDPGDGSETRYRASAIITFRFEDNFWYVYRWEDQGGESDPDSGQILPTMGVLRGTFGSN